MEIIKVDAMKELSELGKEEFEKNALEGSTFKRIMNNIELAALEGYTGWSRTLDASDDVRELEVIKKALTAAGYSCEFKSKQYINLIGLCSTKTTFHINWH